MNSPQISLEFQYTKAADMISFTPGEIDLLKSRAAAIPAQLKNCMTVPDQRKIPVFIAGSVYNGTWLEHNQDCFFAAEFYPEEAWETQKIFMEHQMQCGLIPYSFRYHPFKVCFTQLQTVWPFARCAMEIAKILDRPEEDFARIYDAGYRYDLWLAQNRDRSGSGLVEMFCAYDTGHDNSRRVTDGDIPNACPGTFAGNMPETDCMPVIAADLSAMRYGGLTALAELAEKLDKPRQAEEHRREAEKLKEKIFALLYDAEDEFFYDRAPQGLRKYRTEHITRMFLNRVVDQPLFDRICQRYIESEAHFNAPFPLPSVSLSDPSFDRRFKTNCWGGNTQALTQLRALLWMDHYGRGDLLEEMMRRTLRAYLDHENPFTQEIHPLTGEPLGECGGYVPAMLFFHRAVKRLFP